jgi:hypothetical protein
MSAFKMSSQRWRTWGGERFECWSTEWSDERVVTLREAGLKVRRFEGETYLRPLDFATAYEIFQGRAP